MAELNERFGNDGRFFDTTLNAKEVDIDHIEVRFEWTETDEGRLGNRRVAMPKAVARRLGQWLINNTR